MMKDNTVYLLVGQRGSGKSEYCKKLVAAQPDLLVVSRDEIFVSLFGSVHSDPYSGCAEWGMKALHESLQSKLSTQTGIRLILDSWTSCSAERRALIRSLRQYGATRITALYFITPLELVNEWFWKKSGVAKSKEMSARQGQGLVFYSEDAPERDYEAFHLFAREIDSDGFDEVLRIHPLDPLVVLQ